MEAISEDLPRRSDEGLAALDIFYLDFNDINFYFEDEDQENLYLEVLKKVFPEVRISRVFPLNGKTSVLNHASDPNNAGNPLKSVYVLDKDFDDFLNKIVQDERIFYLDKYCIENYILEEGAIINVVIETYPKISSEIVRRALDFPRTYQELINSLSPLFRLFFCVQKMDLGIRNCACVPEEFAVPGKMWCIDGEKLNNYLEGVRITAFAKSVQPPLDDPLEDERVQLPQNLNPETYISGKYLVACIFHYIKSKYKMGSISHDSFVFRLVKNSSFVELKPVADKIREYIHRK